MQSAPWGGQLINNSGTYMRDQGCAVTGMANVLTSYSSSAIIPGIFHFVWKGIYTLILL
jgi:hypothetical protein